MHANHLKTEQLQQLQLTPVRPVTTTGQTGAQHVHWTSTLTGQTGDLDRSDRCTREPKNGSKPPENLLNASSKTFQALASLHDLVSFKIEHTICSRMRCITKENTIDKPSLKLIQLPAFLQNETLATKDMEVTHLGVRPCINS
jgi:hypothetical protein